MFSADTVMKCNCKLLEGGPRWELVCRRVYLNLICGHSRLCLVSNRKGCVGMYCLRFVAINGEGHEVRQL